MDRRSTLVGILAGVVLLAAGYFGDRLLVVRQGSASRSDLSEARGVAVQAAASVSAALSRIELTIVAGRSLPDVTVDRLALPPPFAPSYGRWTSFDTRPTDELVAMLRSSAWTPQGLPEAVVAALTLERRGAPNADARKQEAGARLLAGELPVRPSELPILAAKLGVANDTRVDVLQLSLTSAPDAPPPFPEFRRVRQGDYVEGWTRRERERLRYTVPIGALLQRARVSRRVFASVFPGRVHETVDGVEDLVVSVTPRSRSLVAFVSLRVGLWLSVALLGAVLIVVLRALRREEHLVAAEKRFLANVTHELRTPLAAVRVFGESLASGRGDPVEYGVLIARESERLESLVERVLTVTRVEEAPRLVPVEPVALARSMCELFRERATRLRFNPPRESAKTAAWDRDAVARALANLLENAIVHGGGEIELEVQCNANEVRYRVADNGPGIREDDPYRVFGRFERGDTNAPGTGLGLHVVEHVARAHRGRVELDTTPDRGAVFTLILPFQTREAGA